MNTATIESQIDDALQTAMDALSAKYNISVSIRDLYQSGTKHVLSVVADQTPAPDNIKGTAENMLPGLLPEGIEFELV
jgi:hypothetical protein